MAAHGFNHAQLEHITLMIREGLRTEGQQQMEQLVNVGNQSIQGATEGHLRRLDEYYNIKTQEMKVVIEKQHQQMVENMNEAERRHRVLEEALQVKEAQINLLVEKVSAFESVKDGMIAELTARQADMEQFKSGIESLNSETRRVLNEATGGWKQHVEFEIQTIKGKLESIVEKMARELQEAIYKTNSVQSTMGPRMAGGDAAGSSGTGAFNHMYEGLIDPRDMKVPEFPSEKPSVDDFRKWLRAFSRHCSRRPGFPCTELIVKSIRDVNEPIDTWDNVEQLITAAQGQRTEEFPNGPENSIYGTVTLQTHWIKSREKEFYEGIEYALGDKCSDIVAEVGRGKGYELMRQLIRQFDPKNANVRQHYIAELHGLTNKKCADFGAVVTRVSVIERIVREMQEVCGDVPDDEVLADVFAPSLDSSSNSELATMRKSNGSLIDRSSYKELREYVRDRQAREKIIEPIKPRKMEVSAISAEEAASKAKFEALQTYWSQGAWGQSYEEAEPQANAWSHPTPGPWTEVTGGKDSLYPDAMGKGKGKGKNGKGKGDGLICRNCLGKGHPARLCASEKGAGGKGGKPCEACGGKGHGAAHCTSKGGGKFVPQEERK